MTNYAHHLARAITLMLLLALSSPLAVTAADPPTTLPGLAPFETGVTIDFLVSGQIDSGISSTPHVIVEQIELDTDAGVPFADAIQIIAVLDGRLILIDDFGLPASLKAGKQTFAPAGAFYRIKAAEPTTLLRARIASPSVDITIFDDHCDPAQLTRASGSTLHVRNATGETQPFTISSLDIDVEIPAGQIASISLEEVEAARWVASCGKRPDSTAPIDIVTLTVSNDAPLSAITPAAVPDGTSVLFDDAMLLADDSSPTFSFAQLTLAPAGSLGEQTFPGPTGIITGDQPLQIERPGKPKATLKAGDQVLLPAETVATVSNPGTTEATTWIVSMSVAPEASPEPPEPAPTATPEAPAETPDPTGEKSDLNAYLPSGSAVRELGLVKAQVISTPSFSDSPYAESPYEDQWIGGIVAIYSPTNSSSIGGVETDGIVGGTIFVDQFTTSAVASEILAGMTLGAQIGSGITPFELPANVHADDAVGATISGASELEGSEITMIVARYGDVVVTVGIIHNPGIEDAEQLAIDLWLAVDATQSA